MVATIAHNGNPITIRPSINFPYSRIVLNQFTRQPGTVVTVSIKCVINMRLTSLSNEVASSLGNNRSRFGIILLIDKSCARPNRPPLLLDATTHDTPRLTRSYEIGASALRLLCRQIFQNAALFNSAVIGATSAK